MTFLPAIYENAEFAEYAGSIVEVLLFLISAGSMSALQKEGTLVFRKPTVSSISVNRRKPAVGNEKNIHIVGSTERKK